MVVRIVALFLILALHAQAATNPPLAALQIEIWPEYDRPRVLVILKAELPDSAALPAELALRLPATSGGPSAVAYADASGKLFNLAHEPETKGNFVTVRIRPPQRYFHVEFYDALALDKPEREYRYTWPGDFAVERLSVLVKEPAAASGFAVLPSLDITGQSPDGLNHRGAQLGALKAGQQLPIEIRYTKSDTRPSTEIVGAAAAAPGTPPETPAPTWPLLLVAAGAAVLLGAIAALVWRRRRSTNASGLYCRKCGKATQAGDRFCANCGATLG
jgi:hypothetical protein